MRNVNKPLAVLVAAALCAGLLAGCAASTASSASSAATPETQAAPTAPATAETDVLVPTPPATAESAATVDVDTEKLNAALAACVNFEADTAGGSLKAAQAAAGLVEYLAGQQQVDMLALATAAQQWYTGLSDDEKANLQLNWAAIEGDAENIAKDPASQAELLADAGVTTDFTTLTLDGVADQIGAIDGVLSNIQ